MSCHPLNRSEVNTKTSQVFDPWPPHKMACDSRGQPRSTRNQATNQGRISIEPDRFDLHRHSTLGPPSSGRTWKQTTSRCSRASSQTSSAAQSGWSGHPTKWPQAHFCPHWIRTRAKSLPYFLGCSPLPPPLQVAPGEAFHCLTWSPSLERFAASSLLSFSLLLFLACLEAPSPGATSSFESAEAAASEMCRPQPHSSASFARSTSRNERLCRKNHKPCAVMSVSCSKTEENPNPWLVHRQPCPCQLSMDPFKLFSPHPIFSSHDKMPALRKLCDQLLDTINVFFQSSNRDDGLASTCGRINPARHQKDGPVDPPTSQPWLHPWRSWDLYWSAWSTVPSCEPSSELICFCRSENAEIRALISLGDLGIHDCQLFLRRISLWSWISTCRHPVSCICLLQLCCTHCFNFCVIKLTSMMTLIFFLLLDAAIPLTVTGGGGGGGRSKSMSSMLNQRRAILHINADWIISTDESSRSPVLWLFASTSVIRTERKAAWITSEGLRANTLTDGTVPHATERCCHTDAWTPVHCLISSSDVSDANSAGVGSNESAIVTALMHERKMPKPQSLKLWVQKLSSSHKSQHHPHDNGDQQQGKQHDKPMRSLLCSILSPKWHRRISHGQTPKWLKINLRKHVEVRWDVSC